MRNPDAPSDPPGRMRLLIIHHEAEYFAGAEKMLGYFLENLASSKHQVTVAAVQESRMPDVIPPGMGTCWLPKNPKFSAMSFLKQGLVIRRFLRQDPFDLIHGWAARDWELTALAGQLTRRPTAATLHDHPRAQFLNRGRKWAMHLAAGFGLRRVVCVSEAVRKACVAAGYPEKKLVVVRNGLPVSSWPERAERPAERFRIGFLGLFSERKGLRGLFQMLDELSRITAAPWEIAVAGDAQEPEGHRLVQELKESYASRAWWPQVHWCGWVKRPGEFLASLDLLICPSSDFDPFPTVLLEAGMAGVAVLGANVGGVAEIIEDEKTGWLFGAADWSEAAQKLKRILECPGRALEAGVEAKKRVEREFTIGRMVENYLRVYTELSDF